MNLYQNSQNKWQQLSKIVAEQSYLLTPTTSLSGKKIFILRLLKENIFVFLLQYTGLMFSTLTPYALPIWFATGTSIAFLFLRGFSILPGIWLGSMAAYCVAKLGFLFAFTAATLFTLQAVALLWLSYYFIAPTILFCHTQQLIKFIVCASLLTLTSSVLLEFCCHIQSIYIAHPIYLGLQWWLANLNGILIFSVALITWDAYFPDAYSKKQTIQLKPIFYYLMLFVLLTYFVFCLDYNPLMVIGCSIAILLLTRIISQKLGWCGAIAASFFSGLLFSIVNSTMAPLLTSYFAFYKIIILELLLLLQAFIGLFIAISKLNQEN